MTYNYPKLPTLGVENIRQFLLDYQNDLCLQMEKLDGKAKFFHDHWERAEGGGGISCVMENGDIFEKAGINFSHVFGKELPHSATKARPELAGRNFEALGVSIVFHPSNPFVPTTHANIRFFCAYDDNNEAIWWFGGGFDLTPYYPFEDDCIHWHQMSKQACHPFEDTLYPKWKKWCDEYFYLPHRHETRGIGGLFFDDLTLPDFETNFKLLQSVGKHFWKGYEPIVVKRRHHPYQENHKDFQRYRRGRYVEFNLLYDRGTLFGIQSKGRTESILMSLPPEVTFKYDWHPQNDSDEERLYQDFLKPREWI